MARPVVSVLIAFATDPLAATPTYVDVSAYVREIRIRRGRQNELNRMEAGTADVVLDNRDRRFDPTYASSPYYPNVIPMRKISIRATWNSTLYYLYTGYIENWPPDWPGGEEATVTVTSVDGFKYFAGALLTVDLSNSDYSGALINNSSANGGRSILTALAWPSADQSVNGGDSIIQGPGNLVNANALQTLQLIADSENGYLWIGADGKIWYRERHYRLTRAGATSSTGGSGSSTSSVGTFGDGGGSEVPYLDLKPSFDDSLIANDIRVTRIGGAEQVATDATSQNRYWKRSLSKTGLLIASDNEALDAANWLLAQYKDPDLRFVRITTAGLLELANPWIHVLERDFHDRITVTARPPGGGTLSQECFIEGIEHQITRDDWLTSWQLSPASSASYWVLQDAVLGILNTTTKLVY